MNKEELVKTTKYLNDKNINHGSSGNLSYRTNNGFVITPSSIPNDKLTEKNCVQVAFDGTYKNKLKPSTEWRIHRDIYLKRKDICAIIHTHPTFSTAIACMNIDIPPFHYMIAVAGGDLVSAIKYFVNHELIFVYDNERRNHETIKKLEATIERHHKVVIWPQYIEHKDINDMVLNGINVTSELENHVYSGLVAKTKMLEFKI